MLDAAQEISLKPTHIPTRVSSPLTSWSSPFAILQEGYPHRYRMQPVAMDCENAAPYALLGLLHRGGDGGCSRFLRGYAASGKNELLWIGLISITFLLLQKLAGMVRLWSQGSRIPGPPSPSFFRPSKHMSANRSAHRDLTGYISKLHEKYGPIVRLWLGPTQILLSVKDVAMVEEMLVKAKDKLPLIGRAFYLAFGGSTLFVSSFDKVQRTRESLALYMNEKLFHRMIQVPGKVVECVMEKNYSITVNDVPESRKVSQKMASYIVGAAVYGDAFMNWPNAALYEKMLATIAKEACHWAAYIIPPFWSSRFWRYHFLCSRLKKLNIDIIYESINSRSISTKCDLSFIEEAGVAEKERFEDGTVFMDAMMFDSSSFQELTRKHLISKEEECGNILSLMFHGFLTTASLINSILTTLALHLELQENIYLEIASLKKKTCNFDLSDVQKLKILLATMYESARLLPPGPFLQRCSLKHELKLKYNLTVPAGTIIVVPLPLVHMDRSVWGKNAEQFSPEHFIGSTCTFKDDMLDEPKDLKEFAGELQTDQSFFSFGSGSRSCVGQKFAIFALATLFASLLQNYEIRLHPGSDSDSKSTVDGPLCLEHLPSPKIIFTKRNKI